MIRIDGRCGAKPGESDRARELRRTKLVTALVRFGLPAKLTRLESGDVSFRGLGPDDTIPRIGIEMKKIPDLLTSIHTGRLAEQLQRMVGTADTEPAFDRSYLLVEGILRAEPGTGIAQVPVGRGAWADAGHGKRRTLYVDVCSFLCSVREIAGVTVIRTSGEQDTLWTLASLYSWWAKPWDKHKSLRGFQAPAPSTGGVLLKTLSDAERVIAGIPQVHYERARAVARAGVFTNLREVFNGTEADWQDVPGIGEGIARNVVALFDAPLYQEARRGKRDAGDGAHGAARAEGDRGDRRPRARAGAQRDQRGPRRARRKG